MDVSNNTFQKCINPDCGAEFDCGQALFKCPNCGELLDARYNWEKIEVPGKLNSFAKRWADRANPLNFSGVWRFREIAKRALAKRGKKFQTLEEAIEHIGAKLVNPIRRWLQVSRIYNEFLAQTRLTDFLE